jgi:flagellar L-ring protein FlgH
MTIQSIHSTTRARVRWPELLQLTVAGVIALAAASFMPSAASAQAPAGAAPAGAAPATTSAATTGAATAPPTVALPAPRESWFADRRNFAVGDIVTVLIDDYTITTAVKENLASDSRGRNLGLTARLPSASKGVGLQTNNDASQNQRGAAKRENRFQNEMSVRVVAVGANGLLQLKGTKNIDVDKAKQDIVLSGWVRAQDISQQNMVESARLADATIGYASPGDLSKPKQGMISKVLGAFWP